jgi:hypothetical protein
VAGAAGAAGAAVGAGGATGGASGTTGTAGATAGTTGAAGATGGASGATGGASGATGGASGASGGTGGASGGTGGASRGTSGGSTGAAGSGGAAGSPAGSGGRSQGGGGGRGGAAGGGAGGAAGAGAGGAGGGGYLCNEVLGFTITSEWYGAGFEKGVVDARWQIKFREHGYITEWANPASAFWGNDAANGAPIISPCAQASTSPDHVVNVLSWTITAQQEWTTDITAAVNTIVAKYPNVRRIDLMTIIRGPGNMLCPTPPAAGETIVMAPELDAAMQAVAAQFPGFVYVAPKFEVTSCALYSGGGPHLTTAGNMAMAPMLATYFAMTQ